MSKNPLLKFLLLLFLALAGQAAAVANSFATTTAPSGYVVYKVVALDPKLIGIDGFLQILQDSRISPRLRKILWGHGSLQPDMALSADDLQRLGPVPLRKAHLRLVDSYGETISDEELEVPLAEIKTIFLYATASPTYLINMDYTTGLGSYRGITTRFAEIKDGRLQYIKAVENDNARPLVLTQSPKSAWRIVPSPNGLGKEIESVSCRPSLDNPKTDDEFYVEYSTYRFDGTKWHLATRQKAGFWEYDGPASWPARNLFPQE